MRSIRTIQLALVGVVLLVTAGSAGPKPVTHTIVIEGARFQPDTLTVPAGDRIVWINKDPYPHTVTSRGGGFDSGRLGTGVSWAYVAARRGTFPYVCTLHMTMKASLTVR